MRAETEPDRVILDPELTPPRPPQPTAWTGLDAFAHALESCTNMRRHPAVEGYFSRSSKNASTFSHASAAASLR